MQITHSALFSIISHQELKKKLSIGAALSITRRHLCSQMTPANLCTTHCSNCAVHILNALEGAESAAKPAGRYVQRLRHEFAAIAESQERRVDDTKRDALGIPVLRGDIFEDMLLGVS
jgi:hypothetical protein